MTVPSRRNVLVIQSLSHLGALLVLVWNLATPATLAGQVETVSDTLCINAARALLDASPDRDYRRSLSGLLSCPESGPPALARAWRIPRTDPSFMTALSNVSAQFRDQRIANAARLVLLDPSRSPGDRLAAMATLLVHAERCLAVLVRPEPPTGEDGRGPLSFGWRVEDVSTEGAQQLSEDTRKDVIELLDLLIKSGPSERVGQAAAQGIRELRSSTSRQRC
jgi:hypothetical protein